MYFLLTMSTIVNILISEVDMSAALHAPDRPANKQLSPNNAMQEPTNDTTIIPWYNLSQMRMTAQTAVCPKKHRSLCTCDLRCLQLYLYWWVKFICQLPYMHQTAPPNSSWGQTMQCKCQLMIQPSYQFISTNTCVPKPNWANVLISIQLLACMSNEHHPFAF